MELGPVSGAARPEQHRFPCPTCGADLRYAPDLDRLKCAHCGYEEAVPEQRGADPGTRSARDRAARAAGRRRPRRSGSRNARAAARRSSSTPTCTPRSARSAPRRSSPTPACSGRSSRRRSCRSCSREEQARAAMNRWLGRLWFAPSDLKAYARAERAMQGIYAPYWTYDAETRSTYTGQRGTVYYVSRPVSVVVNGRRQTAMQQVAQVRWQPAQGRVARDFDDVLVLGVDGACRSASPTRWRPGICRRSAPTSRGSLRASAPRATRFRSRRPTARRRRS